MHARPTSSAGGRPTTSARPGTSFGQQAPPHGGIPYEIEEEYEEESDDEDVFAFLPPSTADQEQAAAVPAQGALGLHQQIQQQQQDPVAPPGGLTAYASPFAHDPSGVTTTTTTTGAEPHSLSQPTSSTSPYAAPQYPTPTFDPWGRTYPTAVLPPSSLTSPAGAPPPPSASSVPSTAATGYGGFGFSTNNPYFGLPMGSPGVGGGDTFAFAAGVGQGQASSTTTGPTGYPHPPPVSPPSTTDSGPSLPSSAGYPAGGGDMYKLKRITRDRERERERDVDLTAPRVGSAGAPPGAGVTSVVDEDEEPDTETSNAGSPVAPTSAAAANGPKEVRVNLPGVAGVQARRSGDKDPLGEDEDVKTGREGDVDLERGADVPRTMDSLASGGEAHKKRRRKSRKHSAPSDPHTHNHNHTHSHPPGANGLPGSSGSQHVRRRNKNMNAGPYYHYAQIMNQYGVGTGVYGFGGGPGMLGGGNPSTARTGTSQSRLNTGASPISGTTAIEESTRGHSAYSEGYRHGHSRRHHHHHASSKSTRHYSQSQSQSQTHREREGSVVSGASSYIAQQKRRDMDMDMEDGDGEMSMVDSLSFDGERGARYGRRGEGSGSESEDSVKMEFDFDGIDEEDSPYPEVRASVSNIDDPDMPALTLRMWFIGLILCMVSGGLNVFFNLRSPAPSIVPLVLLLISYPIGKFLAYIMPIKSYRIPVPNLPRSWLPVHLPSFLPLRLAVNILLPLTYPRAVEFSLNPGPWNIKEHVLVYVMANVAVGSPYAMNAIIVAEYYYRIHLGYWFALTFILATQLTGFGLAGLCRRFLVTPASMVWPQNLVACTLLNTLHAEDEDDGIGMYGTQGKGMTRYRFFVWTTVGSFLFFFIPGYLFKALSIFSFVCWAAPNNKPLNQLFGVKTGLGMSFLTFDWTQISWIGSPLMVPWWAELHIFIGFVLFYWILVPVLYYTNSWSLAYFPISANEPFDRFGKSYNITHVLRSDDTFNSTAYFEYSPLYLPATYAMTYLLAFALSTCVLVHTALYHGPQLWNGFRKVRLEADDIHAKLMRNYPEVPDWWYLVGFALYFALAVVTVEVWHTGVPVWVLLLAIALPVVYVLPSGFIYAMTGQGITINILAQIIPGTLMPGQPFANMIFKALSVQTLTASTQFTQDLKLGHYVKVPPRATFLVQMIGTALAAFVQVGVKQWIFVNVPDVCEPDQKFSLTCPYNQVYFTASAVWGLIGPTLQFGTGSVYHPHLYAIAAGVVLPIPFWLYQRRYPKSWVRYVSIPVILNGVSKIPPATGINYSSWFLVGFVFQYVVRKRNFAWWGKFNYVLSSALDSGSVIGVVVIFLTLQFPGVPDLEWWGNNVFRQTADAARTPLYAIPPGGLPWKDLKGPGGQPGAG